MEQSISLVRETPLVRHSESYAITNCESGDTHFMFHDECIEAFGAEEFDEILLGMHPNLIAANQ